MLVGRSATDKFLRGAAIAGLAGGLLFIASSVFQSTGSTLLEELNPESIVRWTKENQFVMFYQPLYILGLMLYGVLVQAIELKMMPSAPNAARLSNRFGWLTILTLTLMVFAKWFHIFANSVVWDETVALQFSRMTHNIVVFFEMTSLPFLGGWLLATGIGALRGEAFSKVLSWVTIVFGIIVAVTFFSYLWIVFVPNPLYDYMYFLSGYSFLLLIWYSLEILIRNKSVPRAAESGAAAEG